MSGAISIIIPTITGREEWLRKCIKRYRDLTPDAEIIVIDNAPSCGIAWELGAAKATKEYLHFTADDITPISGWYQAALDFISAGLVPAAFVKSPTGALALCNTHLGDMGDHPNILVPFLSREMLDKGGWFQPFHYGTDDWVTYRAVQLGYEVRRCVDYALIHHVAQEGRDYLRRTDDVKALAKAMEDAGYLPPVYKQLEINLRDSKTGLDSVSVRELDIAHRQQIQDYDAR